MTLISCVRGHIRAIFRELGPEKRGIAQIRSQNGLVVLLNTPPRCPYSGHFFIDFMPGRMRKSPKSPPVSSIRLPVLWARAPGYSGLANLCCRTVLSTVPGPLARTGMLSQPISRNHQEHDILARFPSRLGTPRDVPDP